MTPGSAKIWGCPTEKFTRTDVRGLLELPASELNILILIKTWEPNLDPVSAHRH